SAGHPASHALSAPSATTTICSALSQHSRHAHEPFAHTPCCTSRLCRPTVVASSTKLEPEGERASCRPDAKGRFAACRCRKNGKEHCGNQRELLCGTADRRDSSILGDGTQGDSR